MRVLVAEDNKVNQQVILRMLRLEKVQDVTVAKDGQEALDTVQKSMALDGLHFALVFMDILMPNMDGIESTKRIRDLGFSAPIVALTAFADESNKEACMKAGMNAFLGKPIKRHSLKQVLEEFGKPLLPMPGEGNAKGSVEVPTDFITQRRIRLHDFLPLYERNAEKIGSKKTRVSEYDHTLSTVWEMSLARLSGPAAHLQKLLAFFEPDAIHEIILLEGSSLLDDQELKFLEDEMDLGDAEEVLLRAALIGKSLEDGILSVRRLVQAAVMRSLSKDERTRYFDAAVCMLKWGFPDTWSKDVGHQIQAWTKCEKCLPHANRLVTVASKYDISFNKPDQFGDLLLRCSWYLYEREQYDLARTFAATALDTFLDKESLAFASAIDLLGLIDLDMNQPISALDPFNRALRIRQARLGPDDPFIAFSLNNLAIAYTEIPDLAKAAELHEKAIAIRLQNNSGRIGNSYSNLAVLLLRMGKPDEAEETLMKCPSLKDCTDETFLNTGNPRFVGDMVLLSRIRRAQGRIQDALRLASKALSWRQKVHGDRFKTCDSLYDVACLLHQQQRSASAINASDLLRQLVVKLGDEMA